MDRPSETLSVYNALPFRNRHVRETHNTDLTAHMGPYGSYSGSALSAGPGEAHTALTGSVHKVNRNTDYDRKFTSTLQAYRTNSVKLVSGGAAGQFYRDNTDIDTLKKMTWSFWINFDSLSAFSDIFSLGNNVFKLTAMTGTKKIFLHAYNELRAAQGDPYARFTPDVTLELNKWYHIVFSLDLGDNYEFKSEVIDYSQASSAKYFPKFWINGKPVKVTATGLAKNLAGDGDDGLFFQSPGLDFTNLVINGRVKGNYSTMFTGWVSDISLWSDILADTEVSSVYRLPGYDSAGPGDLNILKFVNSRPEENRLHSWWKFNNAGVATDFAPHEAPNGHASLGQYLESDSSAVVDTSTFLPANYYTTECAESYDNYFVQHPIPANAYGYSWLTSSTSYFTDEGCSDIQRLHSRLQVTMGQFIIQVSPREYYHPIGKLRLRTSLILVEEIGFRLLLCR